LLQQFRTGSETPIDQKLTEVHMAKSVFITGATSGFGEATARRFSAEGWNVAISGRRTDRLNKLKAELKGPCHVVTLDVTDRAAVEAAFNSLPAPFSPVDVLVNNAGLAVDEHSCRHGPNSGSETVSPS
jgi:NADP-dependent 3-hydroxy acid dehydrogenase YdfG